MLWEREQALSQVRCPIRRPCPSAANTAAAARHVAEDCPPGLAAICSREAAEEYGLTVLKEGIQNEAENTTRFIIIAKEAVLPEEAGKISLCFSLPHVTGSLSSVLERFSMAEFDEDRVPAAAREKFRVRFLPGLHREYPPAPDAGFNLRPSRRTAPVLVFGKLHRALTATAMALTGLMKGRPA